MSLSRVSQIAVVIQRNSEYRDTLRVSARLDGIRIFDEEMLLPPPDDMLSRFDQIFEVAKEATRSAILKAKEIDEKP